MLFDPAADVEVIEARLDAVDELLHNEDLFESLQAILSRFSWRRPPARPLLSNPETGSSARSFIYFVSGEYLHVIVTCRYIAGEHQNVWVEDRERDQSEGDVGAGDATARAAPTIRQSDLSRVREDPQRQEVVLECCVQCLTRALLLVVFCQVRDFCWARSNSVINEDTHSEKRPINMQAQKVYAVRVRLYFLLNVIWYIYM